jgi:hypothetical protein
VGVSKTEDRRDKRGALAPLPAMRRQLLQLGLGLLGTGLAGAGVLRDRLGDPLGLAETDAASKRRKRRKRKNKNKRRGGSSPVGPALYPDLQTLPPSDLSLDRLDSGVRVLRFTNTVWNAGPGRLELAGDVDPGKNTVRAVFQKVYDAPVGGRLVSRTRVNGRIIYHGAHKHYHFADFAEYVLLKRGGDGVYRPMGAGTKTSFCVTDNNPLQSPYPQRYPTCQRREQGLTPGWGDTYRAELPDQWVVIGDDQLEDGEYAMQSTVDPRGLLNEGGNDNNNTATTYFTVDKGDVENPRTSP